MASIFGKSKSTELRPLLDQHAQPRVVITGNELAAITAETKKQDEIRRQAVQRTEKMQIEEGFSILNHHKYALFEDVIAMLRKAAAHDSRLANIPASYGTAMKWDKARLTCFYGCVVAEAKEWTEFLNWATANLANSRVLKAIFHRFFSMFLAECVPDKSITFTGDSDEVYFSW